MNRLILIIPFKNVNILEKFELKDDVLTDETSIAGNISLVGREFRVKSKVKGR